MFKFELNLNLGGVFSPSQYDKKKVNNKDKCDMFASKNNKFEIFCKMKKNIMLGLN